MDESRRIALEIITPSGGALSDSVDDLTAPSVDGEFGVLPGHRPLLASLKTGVISFHRGVEETRVAVGSGFIEICDDRAVVLTDQFITKDQIDVVRVRLELKESTEELARYEGQVGDADFRALVARQLWSAAQLELYGDPPAPTMGVAEWGAAAAESYGSGGDGSTVEDTSHHS